MNDNDKGDDGDNIVNHPFGDDFPVGTDPLDNQVAGHRFGSSPNNLALLRHRHSQDILKPICDKRSEREFRLYSQIWDSDNDFREDIQNLRQFVPKFNGIFVDQKTGRKYIRLTDISNGMKNPSVLDIKIGAKTYDLEANEQKILSEITKYRFQSDIGFRILGMRIYKPEDNNYVIKEKDYGIRLTPHNVGEALVLYVQNNRALIREFSRQMKVIKEWFDNYNHNKWQFISSSLLFVYDCHQSKAVVNMIDFAHVFPNDGLDDNYLFGLNKLIQYFDSL
ncbi:inositol polyphosphate multikinase-like [Oppia nitens]|uniref:inositol polyphosphate multikinase-like n=1 Tax=Oppia nitens TaxID=1686743 RepID=UPI0023DBB260|nr:inositol polyphosphate multikinase-like [Oppia nitens]